jgi:hypothetical protein
MQQMGFSKANTAMNEERVVRTTRFRCDRERSCVRQTVARANDERLKVIVRTEEHLLIKPRRALAGLVFNGGWRRTARLNLCIFRWTHEAHHEKSACDVLRRFREVGSAAALEVTQLHWLANDEPKHAIANL